VDYSDYFGMLNDFEKKNAPKHLFTYGDFNLLSEGKRISVVGSRNVSEEGAIRAKIVSKILVENGFIVVSGLAKGVDTVAHKTAIACGGKTIAVLGTPIDEVYPKENYNLLESIKSDHLAVSQFESGWKTTPKNFPMRNRTMALISDATIIIEAKEKSGTIHQGWEALRLGRRLFIMENIEKSNYPWVSEMKNYGAQILTRENIGQCLEEIPGLTQKFSDAFAF